MNKLIFKTDRFALFADYVTDEYVELSVKAVYGVSTYSIGDYRGIYGYRNPSPERRNWRGRVVERAQPAVYDAIQHGIALTKRLTREAEDREAREAEMKELVTATIDIEREMHASGAS